jgi:hyperpolarization activated cyclic nucleotide-gated potassium channel 2
VDIVACLPFELAIRASSNTLLCSFLPDGCDESYLSSDGEPKGGFGGGDSSLLMVVKLLRLVRLAKLLRLMRLGRLLDRYQDDLFHLFHLLSVVKLAIILLYLGHIFGCFFYFFSDKEWRAPEEMEDLDVEGCNDLPWLLKFYNDVPVEKFNSEFSTRYIASLCVLPHRLPP